MNKLLKYKGSIYYRTVKNDDYFADLLFAEYEIPEKACEVLQQIFDAMNNGEKTFELPEI